MKNSADKLFKELLALADRANVAFAAGQHALADELLRQAKQIAWQIDRVVRK